MTDYRIIGTPVPRVDGFAKASGSGEYAADVGYPGMLWAAVLHSPVSHALIKRIDVSRTWALEGVRSVLTGSDTGGTLFGRGLYDVPALASDRVRFIGDRVAVVAADDLETAQRALQLIEVDYEEIPAVFDPLEAMTADAPIIHPDARSYVKLIQPPEGLTNTFSHEVMQRGDLEEGFRLADHVVEDTYTVQRHHHAYLEAHACVGWLMDDGRLHLWTSNKMPHDLKVDLAAGLGIEEDRVCVHPILVGGDFGGKGAPYDEQLCYFLSMATGRPVKIVRSYSEELTATATRHKVVMRLKSGVKRDGTLLATHMQVIADAGAYGGYLSRPNLSGASRVWSTYGVPNFAVDSYRVYTNNVPGGQVRAPGNPQGAFAMESHMDSIARTLGMDPVELRMRNLPGDDEETAVGVRFPDPKGKETLQAAAEAAALHGPKPPHVGRGIAIAQRPQSGGGEASAELTLTPDGEVIIGSAIFSQGTASTTVLQQIVAEAMGVPIESTSVLVKDTDSIAYDNGLRGSGMTRKISGVGHALTQAVQTELLNLAGSVLEWPRAATVFAAPYLVREDTGSQMHWSEVLGRARSTITKQVTYKDEGHTAHFIAQVAEVRVDPDTGQVDLLKMTTAHDVGQVIDPIGHQGQVNGGVIQGVGYAMMEEVAVEQGRVLTPSLADYKVPAITDIPALQTVLVDSGQGGGPYKVKGIGEGPVIPTAAAIANAVEDAVGVRVRDLPITAEKVYDLLRRGQEAAPSRRANPRES